MFWVVLVWKNLIVCFMFKFFVFISLFGRYGCC